MPNLEVLVDVGNPLEVTVDGDRVLEVTLAGELALEISPIGIQGPRGLPGEASRIIFPFAYGDASPAIAASVAGLVVAAAIIITVPFDGVGANLSLGDGTVSDRLLPANCIDPYTVATYEANLPHSYTVTTAILLSITPGAGATQGAGFVVLEV